MFSYLYLSILSFYMLKLLIVDTFYVKLQSDINIPFEE